MFTEFEKKILDSMDPRYKWIARDKDGTIAVFAERPDNYDTYFYTSVNMNSLPCLSELFQEVTWECSPVNFRTPILDEKERNYLTE